MLILSRKEGESIRIGNQITVVVVRTSGDKIRLGIEAPSDVPVHRSEVYERIQTNEGQNVSLGQERQQDHFLAVRKSDGARCVLWKFLNIAGFERWQCSRANGLVDVRLYDIIGPVTGWPEAAA